MQTQEALISKNEVFAYTCCKIGGFGGSRNLVENGVPKGTEQQVPGALLGLIFENLGGLGRSLYFFDLQSA